MADIVKILNTIQANASTDYQNRVPQATKDNIQAVGNAITEYAPVMNEFITTLFNKIGLSIIISRMHKNPLSILKKDSMTLGSDIEEIFIDMAKDKTFDPQGADLMQKEDSKVLVTYHNIIRKSKYKVSITLEQLQQAFTNINTLESFLMKQINSMYSGDSYDEFLLMKHALTSVVTKGLVPQLVVKEPTDKTTATAFLKEIRKVSKAMGFASSSFNGYNILNPDANIKTWVEDGNKVLIIPSDYMEEINVESLATLFNVEKANLRDRVIEIDSFLNENIYAMILDTSFIEVRDMLYKLNNFDNSSGLFSNYFLHHWQHYKISLFANCVALVKAKFEPTVEAQEKVTKLSKNTVLTEKTE